MRGERPRILAMGVWPRSLCVCALVLLQLASASGHVLHHAWEGAAAERCTCTDAAGRMDESLSATCHHGSDTDPPVRHDSNGCFLCDASHAQIARLTQQQRLIENAAAACLSSDLTAPEPLAGWASGVPPAAPPVDPATLHAITLPLLD
jgi:hypothetical protein